jgi:hypothetical protein
VVAIASELDLRGVAPTQPQPGPAADAPAPAPITELKLKLSAYGRAPGKP